MSFRLDRVHVWSGEVADQAGPSHREILEQEGNGLNDLPAILPQPAFVLGLVEVLDPFDVGRRKIHRDKISAVNSF